MLRKKFKFLCDLLKKVQKHKSENCLKRIENNN